MEMNIVPFLIQKLNKLTGECRLVAQVLKVRFDEIEKIELIGGTEAKTLTQAVAGYSRKPDYVFNAGHFDNGQKSKTYGVTISDTIVDGKPINTSTNENIEGNWKYEGNIYTNIGLAFNDDGKMEMCSTSTAYNKHYHSFIGGSPHLFKHKVNSNKLKTAFAKQKVYRIAMGFNNNEIIVGFPSTKMNLTELSDFMKKQGANHAIALDGGGSVNVRQLVGSGYKHIDELNYNRPVSTFVCIWLKKTNVVTEKPKVTVETEAKSDVPQYNGLKAIGVYEVVWQSVNRRAGNGTNYALVGDPLKKGDRITVFKQNGNWIQSYGYWISLNSVKLVKKY